jgi:NADH-quinone oxidoreductase subunit G
MATIHVDGKEYEVDGADNLLGACLSLGLDIPYFCWHPELGSVGACRQCAVKQYANPEDTRGRLVMSCMTPATDGTSISITDEEAKAFRASVVEWLMTNHPHDCPVCAEGGHCHLQDMTVMTGHSTRKYRFSKRTHENQYLGSFINHEMNRCIACYRCVRYYKDYAGGTDLGVFGAHDNVYFGRETDGVLQSEFSGNLVEVCPTGVFTDKTHSEHYNRKWDMQFAPSICQQCGVGCNTSPGERYGEIRRIENRYNGDVNHYFLCDRGRFGYGYANRDDRPGKTLIRQGDGDYSVTNDAALERVANALRQSKRIMGIGSPRASLEANYALRELVGVDNFYNGIEASELARLQLMIEVLTKSGAQIPSLREIEDHDAVFILGEDITQTAPRIALAVRQAVGKKAQTMAADKNIAPWLAEAVKNIGQHEKNPLFIGSVDATRLDDVAAQTFRHVPEEIARLGFAVAHAIDASSPAVSGLDIVTTTLAQKIASALLRAQKPLIVSGAALGSESLIQAAANIAKALADNNKKVSVSLAAPEANSIGLALLGGQSLDIALNALRASNVEALIIMENDLYRRADKSVVDMALSEVDTIVVLDHQKTATADKATMLLPAASFAEGDGTLINNEGRAQRYFQVYDPTYYDPDCQIKESWRWLHAINNELHDQDISWTQLDEVTAACAEAIPALQKIVDAAPNAQFRVNGLKIAREPHRYSGRTAMRADISVHEPRQPQDIDSAMTFSMEGCSSNKNTSSLVPFAWSPGWNSPQAWNKFQDEVGGHMRAGDSGVRLLESTNVMTHYFSFIPSAFAVRANELRIVPLHHIFGSDELSSMAQPIIEQTPEAYIAVSPTDAKRFDLREDSMAEVNINGVMKRAIVKIHNELLAGTIGLPIGLNGVYLLNNELWTSVSLVSESEGITA